MPHDIIIHYKYDNVIDYTKYEAMLIQREIYPQGR